ncbi:MAG: ABC transporter substrate-binding protein [Armatimonadetes bacterium]|nr:ABC transporter substrate-binding protein [Armatimonadota bacterium]
MRFLPRAVLALLLGSVVLLSGCARPGAASRDGRVHISYWEKWTGFEGDAMRAVVDAYNASQDRIFVDLLTVSQVDQKLLLATAGGNPPDVAGLWSNNTHVYADMNAIRTLDDLCEQAGIGPRDFIPSFWDLCTYRGHVFALPTTPATVALHYNKKLMRAAGLDPDRPPRTIEELDAAAARLTTRDADGKIDIAGFLPSEPGWWNWAWGYWFGGELYDGKSKLTVTSPENLRAFTWVQQYAKTYGTQAIQVFQSGFGNFSSPQNPFVSGKVAMELQGVWMYNFIDKFNKNLEWGVAPFPYPADRPDLAGQSLVDMDTLVIPSGSRHPREAFEFMRYVASPAGAELLNLGQRKFSPLTALTPDFYQRHPHPYLRDFVKLAYAQRVFSPPKLAIWKEFGDEMSNAFSKIWLVEETPEQALGRVQDRMQRKLDREIRQKRRKGLVQ